ncbi:uncharacterized protein [Lepisosteus oculatus]|uniref:uncharacterized protein n=1 Tax=Lepisosteus oculatus TaxID=7918 RepID=UPI0003EA9C57|nr:PREDICTED: uncharacterized protein LOC102688780 [Lepisosteus oculatus]XP_015204918.1 PREDICTED: uncharacterized protein LOC102688780 [Lepisosteus oculatus]
MRPRSRLLTTKRLPTICEVYEEILQDMNHASTCSNAFYIHSDCLSSEDYLQSICQLARPTFPVLQEPLCEIVSLNKLDALRLGPQLPKLPASAPLLDQMVHYHTSSKEAPIFTPFLTLEGVHPRLNKSSNADPLEYLYGQHNASCLQGTKNNRKLTERTEVGDVWGSKGHSQLKTVEASHSRQRANSFPQLCSPRPMQRKISCPELQLEGLATQTPNSDDSIWTSLTGQVWPHPPKDKKPSVMKPPPRSSQSLCHSETKCNSSIRNERSFGSCFGQTDKQNMISSWIADCKSAWKEARIRACMLPAIAEM